MGGVDAAVFHALKCLRVALLRAVFYVSRTELLTKTATYQQFCEKLG